MNIEQVQAKSNELKDKINDAVLGFIHVTGVIPEISFTIRLENSTNGTVVTHAETIVKIKV